MNTANSHTNDHYRVNDLIDTGVLILALVVLGTLVLVTLLRMYT